LYSKRLYMFLLRDINPLSLKLLNRIYRESRHHQVRQRAQFLILASQNIKNKNLMKIFKVSYKTMYNWLNRWENQGMLGLYNKPGRGRKETFNSAQLDEIRDWVKLQPRQLKQVVQKIKKEWSINISTETIKRIIKKKG
jgi:transposase